MRLLALLVALLGTLAVSAPAHAASVSIAVSADPVQDKPVTVTVAGESGPGRRLWVLYSDSASCSPYVYGTAGTALTPTGGESVGGSFSKTYSFAPTKQAGYLLCAYVGERIEDQPEARDEAHLTSRAAHVAVAIDASPNPAVGQPVTVSVTGSSELARTLWVEYTQPASSRCASYPGSGGSTLLTPELGQAVDGAFSRSYSFVPASDADIRICAYVDRAVRGQWADATAMTSIVFPKPPIDPGPGAPPPPAAPVQTRLTLIAPESGKTGSLLNPSFVWRSPSPEDDVLLLSKLDAKRGWVRLVTVAPDGYRMLDPAKKYTLENLARASRRLLSPTKKIARYEVSGEDVNVRFLTSLAPGRYRWVVLNPEEEYGAGEREFTLQPPPLSTLGVTTRARLGRSSRAPGKTELLVKVTPYTPVRIELRRNGRRYVSRFAGDDRSTLRFSVPWSCRDPGGRFRYTVTARDATGKTLTRSGSFRPISAGYCRQLRAYEADVARYKAECKRRGGRPKEIRTKRGSEWTCVAR